MQFKIFVTCTFIVPDENNPCSFRFLDTHNAFDCLNDVAKFISDIDYPPFKIFIKTKISHE